MLIIALVLLTVTIVGMCFWIHDAENRVSYWKKQADGWRIDYHKLYRQQLKDISGRAKAEIERDELRNGMQKLLDKKCS
jgi:hypothetical protein